MKKKDLNDLKTKNLDELAKKIGDLEKGKTNELLELKMGKTKNVHATGNIKKDIAKINTIIKMKLVTEKPTSKKKKEEESSVEKTKMTETKSHAPS